MTGEEMRSDRVRQRETVMARAKRIGISAATLKDVEQDWPPSFEDATRVANFYGVSVSDLWDASEFEDDDVLLAEFRLEHSGLSGVQQRIDDRWDDMGDKAFRVAKGDPDTPMPAGSTPTETMAYGKRWRGWRTRPTKRSPVTIKRVER
jgi:transcriptional regulator with XRE-family HTH domain